MITHTQKPGDRHQNQDYRTFQSKVTNIVIFSPLYLILSAQNDKNGHLGQSGYSDVGDSTENSNSWVHAALNHILPLLSLQIYFSF